jgi:hypothetical protein
MHGPRFWLSGVDGHGGSIRSAKSHGGQSQGVGSANGRGTHAKASSTAAASLIRSASWRQRPA